MSIIYIDYLTKEEANYIAMEIEKTTKEHAEAVREGGRWSVHIDKSKISTEDIFKCVLWSVYKDLCINRNVEPFDLEIINDIGTYVTSKYEEPVSEYGVVSTLKEMLRNTSRVIDGGVLWFYGRVDRNPDFNFVARKLEDYCEEYGYSIEEYFPPLESLLWTSARLYELQNCIKSKEDKHASSSKHLAELFYRELMDEYPDDYDEIFGNYLLLIKKRIERDEKYLTYFNISSQAGALEKRLKDRKKAKRVTDTTGQMKEIPTELPADTTKR